MRKRSKQAMRNPAPPKPASQARPWNIAIAAAALAATICKLVLAMKTYGSNDVYAYERFFGWSHYLGAELYQAAWDFNHPPSMLHVFRILGWLTDVSGLWFPFWLRLPAIIADVGSLWILFEILRRRLHEASIRQALLMFAAAPALILISGFHGNTDSVMLFFLLLSVALMERGLSGRAGVAFGLAMCFKIVPVIALPVIFLYQTDRRKRIAFMGAAGITLLVAWSPYLYRVRGRCCSTFLDTAAIPVIGAFPISHFNLATSRRNGDG